MNARRNGSGIFVHCAQGKSRSAACVVAYTMTSLHLSVDDALAKVRTRRRMAEPNHGDDNTLQHIWSYS